MIREPRSRSVDARRSGWRRARLAMPALALGVLATTACSHRPDPEPRVAAPASPAVASSGYKVGRPYQIKGIWYRPEVNYEYSEVGIASWYGPGFHGKATANGETYDQNDLTAAHKTLPLPSVVRVTNLENGRTLKVRINDRGPFVDGRIIDLSRRGAQLLGFFGAGTAQVQVDIVADESYAMAQALGANQPLPAVLAGAAPSAPAPVVVAAAAPPAPPLASADDAGGDDATPAAAIGVVAMAPVWSPGDPLPARETPAASGAAAPAVVTTADLPEIEPAAPSPAAAGRWSFAAPAAAAETPLSSVERRTYVQAGAFADPERAARAQQRLASIGPTLISPQVVNGRALSRVRVGPLRSTAEADRVLAWVAEAGFAGSHLVSE